MVPAFPLRHTSAATQQNEDTLSAGLPRLFPASVSQLLPRSFELFRFIFRAAIWLDLLKAELLLPLGRHPHRLSVVGHGKGTIRGSGLQKSQEDRRPRAERTGQGEGLAGLLVPLEFGLLHEEGVFIIPAGCFDGVGIGEWTSGSQYHRQPLQGGTAPALPAQFAPSR